MKKRLFLFIGLLASILGVLPLCAQESCYAQYLREHNMRVLTAEDADDSYDELKKAVLAWQMYGSEASRPLAHGEDLYGIFEVLLAERCNNMAILG